MNYLVEHFGSLLTGVGVIFTTILGFINKRQIQEVHLTINSRLDALLLSVAATAHQEGVVEEKVRATAEAVSAAKSKILDEPLKQ